MQVPGGFPLPAGVHEAAPWARCTLRHLHGGLVRLPHMAPQSEAGGGVQLGSQGDGRKQGKEGLPVVREEGDPARGHLVWSLQWLRADSEGFSELCLRSPGQWPAGMTTCTTHGCTGALPAKLTHQVEPNQEPVVTIRPCAAGQGTQRIDAVTQRRPLGQSPQVSWRQCEPCPQVGSWDRPGLPQPGGHLDSMNNL